MHNAPKAHGFKPAYTPEPNAIYTISGTEAELAAVLNSASFGIDPFLMQTETPANRLTETRKYLQNLLGNMMQQIRKKYVADSLKSTLNK